MAVNSKKMKKRSSGRPVGTIGNLKNQIIEAFFKGCFEEGIEAMTLQKVADYSGVALATVRYHFNLQGHSLSMDALNYVNEKTYEWIDQGMTKARASENFNPVLSYIEVMFDWVEKNPILASYLVYFYYLNTTKINLPLENRGLIEIAQKRIQSLIHESLGMKIYLFEGDTALLSRQIHTLVMGGCMIAATARSPEIIEAQKKLCRETVGSFLRANDSNSNSRN